MTDATNQPDSWTAEERIMELEAEAAALRTERDYVAAQRAEEEARCRHLAGRLRAETLAKNTLMELLSDLRAGRFALECEDGTAHFQCWTHPDVIRRLLEVYR